MLNFLKHLNAYGKIGYEAFFILGAIGFVVLFFWPPLKYSPIKQGGAGNICVYNPPVSSVNFTDDGKKYDLIRKSAAIIMEQPIHHLEKTVKILKVGGVDRKVYKTVLDANGQVVASTWLGAGDTTDDWLRVRYVDVTDTIAAPAPGNLYYDIYLESGTPLPKFISNHCANNPVEERSFLSDNFDQSFPPKEIDAAKITNWSCPANSKALCSDWINLVPKDTKYYLYAYDTDGNEIVIANATNGFAPIGQIELSSNGNPQKFEVAFYNGVESKHLRLIVSDPLKPGVRIGYRYANPDRLTIPIDPYKFLNKTQTATNSLQLQAYNPWKIPPAGWWTPECKPAIYLYPKNKMNVNVKVTPKGFMTYTDPVYDQTNGWNVTAYPDGKLSWLDKTYGINSKGEKRASNTYEYLYYESKIHDSMITKPTEGYVIAYADLEQFYREYLPEMGLNEKETNDYVEYWVKVLPHAEYYFIGLLSEQNVAEIEPMAVTPAADSILRVRLYYEQLSESDAAEKIKTLKHPNVKKEFKREGFTVVEWGGMVKQDNDHPFTCSM